MPVAYLTAREHNIIFLLCNYFASKSSKLEFTREISEFSSKAAVSPFPTIQELSDQRLFSFPTLFGSGQEPDDKRPTSGVVSPATEAGYSLGI